MTADLSVDPGGARARRRAPRAARPEQPDKGSDRSLPAKPGPGRPLTVMPRWATGAAAFAWSGQLQAGTLNEGPVSGDEGGRADVRLSVGITVARAIVSRALAAPADAGGAASEPAGAVPPSPEPAGAVPPSPEPAGAVPPSPEPAPPAPAASSGPVLLPPGGAGPAGAAPDAGPTPTVTPAGPGTRLPPGLPKMPVPAMTPLKAQQARIAGVQHRAAAASKATAAAPPAAANVSAARTAVQVPQAENNALKAEQVASDLSVREKPSLEIEKLCTSIRDLIESGRPLDEDGVIKTVPEQVASEAGRGVEGDVQRGVDATRASYGPLDATPRGAPVATAPRIEPQPSPAPTADVGAAAAAPEPIPPGQVSLDEDASTMELKAHGAGLDQEPAQLVTSGPIADARAAEGDMRTLAGTAPQEAIRQEQGAIAESNAGMAALQATADAALKEARARHADNVKTQQDQFKGGEEDTHGKLSEKAEKAFTAAQSQVDSLLKDVQDQGKKKWATRMPQLTRQFNDDLQAVKNKVAKRHSGIGGWFVSGWDTLTGLPGWVKKAYATAEKNFGNGVCALMREISSDVNTVIKRADQIIATARDDIHDIFTRDLPAEQRSWGAEQLKAFDHKLDRLHAKAETTRATFNKDLIQKAGDAVQAAHQKVQELRKKAESLWERFEDGLKEFLNDPVKFVIDGLLNLVGIPPPAFWAVVHKIMDVITDIARHPVKFANNLMRGIGDGFGLFFAHIGRHLLEGLIKWLLSGLEKEGIAIQVPQELTAWNVVVFFLDLLGISWARIRKILVKELGGEQPVVLIEKTVRVIATLKDRGISGVIDDIKAMFDPKTIIDTIISTAIRFVTENLIFAVAKKLVLLLNPIGAILAAIQAIYEALKWVFHNAERIFRFIEAVVNTLAEVVAGNVAVVAQKVEDALAMMVPVVIDFLASYLDLDGLPGKVAEAVKGLQDWVEAGLQSVVKWLVGLGRQALAAVGIKGKEDPGQEEQGKKPGTGEVGKHVPFAGGGEAHEIFIEVSGTHAVVMIASQVTTVENWLKERDKDLSRVSTTEEVKTKAPPLIAEARRLAGLTGREASTVAAEVNPPAGPAAAASQEKAERDEKTVEHDEQALAGVLKKIADLLGIEHPIVVKAVVARSPLRLEPPLGRQLVEDLAAGSRPSIYLTVTSDKTLIANLVKADSEAFNGSDGTLSLPALDAAAISAARDADSLGSRVGKGTFVRRVRLRSDASGFSVDAGYDAMAAGIVTGPRLPAERERWEKTRATPLFAPEPADGRFKPPDAQAEPYPQASREPFTVARYRDLHAATVRLSSEDAREEVANWRATGEAGRLSKVGSEGATSYVITGGSVYAAVVIDAAGVDPQLRAAVDAYRIVPFMKALAAGGQAGQVTYAQFTELWKRSVNRDWLKDRFRDAGEGDGMHEWIPSNYIPQTIARAADPGHFLEGAAWIDLHHRLRSDTGLLIFKPEYWWLEGKGPRAAWIPQGHVGAVYVGAEPQPAHQGPFHDDLREAFNKSTGIQSCIEGIHGVFTAWIWDGSGGKTPLYPGLRGKFGMLPNDAKLAEYQAKNYAEVQKTFQNISAHFTKAET